MRKNQKTYLATDGYRKENPTQSDDGDLAIVLWNENGISPYFEKIFKHFPILFISEILPWQAEQSDVRAEAVGDIGYSGTGEFKPFFCYSIDRYSDDTLPLIPAIPCQFNFRFL